MMQTSEKPKILLADDADVGRSILRALLRKEFDVVEASNGLEAVKALSTEGGRFAAVLLDVMMPVMDGFRVLKFMREKDLLGRIPAIMITAISDADSKVRCYEAGATDLIEKPIDEKIFVHKVRALVSCISARSARSEEEDEARAYAEGLLDALPDAVFSTDPNTHAIKFCNETFRNLPGIVGDPVGHDVREILPEHVTRIIVSVWEDLVIQHRRTFRLFRFPGDPRVWCVSYNALLDDAGEISDYIGHITDVTLFLQAAPQLESTLHVDQNAEVIL
jgi:CheY-like chemotaxis protein